MRYSGQLGMNSIYNYFPSNGLLFKDVCIIISFTIISIQFHSEVGGTKYNYVQDNVENVCYLSLITIKHYTANYLAYILFFKKPIQKNHLKSQINSYHLFIRVGNLKKKWRKNRWKYENKSVQQKYRHKNSFATIL